MTFEITHHRNTKWLLENELWHENNVLHPVSCCSLSSNRGRQTVVLDCAERKLLMRHKYCSGICAATKLYYSSRIRAAPVALSVVLVSHGQGNCFLLFLLQTVAWLCLFLVIFPMAFPWPRSQAADRWTTQLYEQDAVSRRQRDVHLTAAILLWKNPSHKLLMQSRKHCVISCVTPSLCVWAATTTTTTMTSYFITLSSPFSLH